MKNKLFGALLIIGVCIVGCTTHASISSIRNSTKRMSKTTSFSAPEGLAVDSNGNVYAVNSDKGNVQKFDGSGKFISSFGSKGDTDQQLKSPESIAVDSKGNVYVANGILGGGLQKFDASGKFLARFAHKGDIRPSASEVAVGPDDSIYVIQGMGDSIQKFNASGKYLSDIGSEGTGKGEFIMPKAIAVDGKGSLYVWEPGANFHLWKNGKSISGKAKARIQKFDRSGKSIPIALIGEDASGEAKIWMLEGMATDSSGNLYVLEMNTVKKFDQSGKFVLEWGDMGDKPGQLSFAKSIAADAKGNVYVGDSNNCRIQKFDSSGKFVTEWHMK